MQPIMMTLKQKLKSLAFKAPLTLFAVCLPTATTETLWAGVKNVVAQAGVDITPCSLLYVWNTTVKKHIKKRSSVAIFSSKIASNVVKLSMIYCFSILYVCLHLHVVLCNSDEFNLKSYVLWLSSLKITHHYERIIAVFALMKVPFFLSITFILKEDGEGWW